MSAAKTFEFEVPSDADVGALMDRARRKAREVGITIQGDERGGSFSGTAEGRYVVDGATVRLEVEKKPAFVPWSLVEKGLSRAFG